MARVLIVGCGCRGRSLARALLAEGHAVRGTTRSEARVGEIEASGAEGVVADPDRLGTLLGAVEGVSVICWLMASATGAPEGLAALHGSRLRSLLEKLVDTPVRGLVYEARGSLPQDVLDLGAAQVQQASATFRLPVAVISEAPERHERWIAEARAAVASVL